MRKKRDKERGMNLMVLLLLGKEEFISLTLFLCAGEKSTHVQCESECTPLLCVPLAVVKQVADGNGSCSTGKLALKSGEICLFLAGVTDTC